MIIFIFRKHRNSCDIATVCTIVFVKIAFENVHRVGQFSAFSSYSYRIYSFNRVNVVIFKSLESALHIYIYIFKLPFFFRAELRFLLYVEFVENYVFTDVCPRSAEKLDIFFTII